MRRAFFGVLLWVTACSSDGDDVAFDGPLGAADAAPRYDARTIDARPLIDGGAVGLDCTTSQDYPEKLGCTGLYSNWTTKTLSPTAHEFKPGFELWSDGAVKRRWIELPPGTKIDVSNPSEWTFPVGTKVWKEFRFDTGSGLRPIETRLLWKRDDRRWVRATYFWAADGSAADEVKDGVMNVPGTGGYSVPSQLLCMQCHSGRLDELLGFEAVLLAAPEASGLTYAELQRLDLLSSTNGMHTMPASQLQIPGRAVERTALGVMHANCGVSCHNPLGIGGFFEARLAIDENGTGDSVQATTTVQSMVNRRSTFRPATPEPGVTYYRLRPLDVTHSMAPHRMGLRGTGQMPPIATARVDTAGVAAVTAWVNAMTPALGYPPPAPLSVDAGVGPPDAALPAADAGIGVPDAQVGAPDAPIAAAPDAKPNVPDASIAAPDAPIAAPDAAVGTPDAAASCSLPALKLTLVEEGFAAPLFVTAPAGDDRLFVVEKGGAIKIVKDGATLAEPFLTVADWYEPSPSSEGGLLGMAFDPDYASNGRFYLHYTRTPDGNVVVREFHRSDANPDRADAAHVATFIDTAHGGWNHVGGMLAFGADSYLYASIGDAASSPSPTRDLSSKLGKILRLDVDHHPTPPPGNLAGADPYVWDYGLRNPWRFSFDSANGTMYIGDVGQTEWEEIDVEPVGAGPRDYGWDELEATHCYPPAASCAVVGTAPVVEHSHDSGEGTAITGGYVYRGSAIPCLQGRYIYGDYGTNRVFSFVYQGGVATSKVELTSDLDPGHASIDGAASFGEDGSGELYMVMTKSGRVYRIDAQ